MNYELFIRFTTDRVLTQQELNDLIYVTVVQVDDPYDHTNDRDATYRTEIGKADIYPIGQE